MTRSAALCCGGKFPTCPRELRQVANLPPQGRRPQGRRAFTLLEIVVAMSIALLLLAALYVAVNVQINHSSIGRDRIAEGNLARGILQRISSDISSNLPPAAKAATSSATSSTTTATDTTTTTQTTAQSTPTDTTGTTTTGAVNFNLGVQGSANQLVLYVGSATGEVMQNPVDGGAPVSELRRITYWLADGGLARQEVKVVTSDEINAQTPDSISIEDASSCIIAREVTSVEFEYYDTATSEWKDTWDGTEVGADDKTPKGPPAAIRITIKMRSPNPRSASEMEYVHIVAIPTANNLTPTTTNGNRP